MDIGFDASDLCTGRADGTTRYTREVLLRLPGLAPHHTFHVFAPCQDTLSITSKYKNVIWHASPWPKYWTQLRLPLDLFRVKPDILVMPIQQLPIIRPIGMKTISVVHDAAFHLYPDQFTYKDWLLLHVFTAQAAHESDAVITVSQSTADDVRKFYGREKNIHVVHHGVNHKQFYVPETEEQEKSWTALQSKYGNLRKPYILYVGQIQPRKNLNRLIAAFEQLKPKHPDLQLVLSSGFGWLREKTEKRIANSKYKEDILLLGHVPDQLLAGLYWNASVLTLVSMYEGFGLPVLEALACGTPVVTSTVSSLPEIAGDAAVLVNPTNVPSIRDGLLNALENGASMQEKAKAQAQKFNWDKAAQSIVDICEHQV